MKLPQKGWLLCRLSSHGADWDSGLVAAAEQAYGAEVRGGGIRLALEELASAGLVQRCAERLLPGDGVPRLSFRYQLTAFGLQRMRDTGLLATLPVVPQ